MTAYMVDWRSRSHRLRSVVAAARILVVDDEPAIRELVTTVLRYEGFEVATAETGREALSRGRAHPPAPRRARRDAARPRRLRRPAAARRVGPSHPGPVPDGPTTPWRTRSAGLTIGGDDYLTKPFSLEELVARVRAVLRRTAPMPTSAGRRRPRAGRGHLRGAPRRRPHRADADGVQAAAIPHAQPAASRVEGRRSSTTSGSTTSAVTATSSRRTSPTCAARSTPAARR